MTHFFNIGHDIFVGDSAAPSHMMNNKTGVYNLTPIRGSVMIGNGESICCTHKGKLVSSASIKMDPWPGRQGQEDSRSIEP